MRVAAGLSANQPCVPFRTIPARCNLSCVNSGFLHFVGVLTRCSSTAMIVVEGREAAPLPEAPGMVEADALRRWDTNGNGRITCREARAHGIAPVRRGHPAYPFMRDGDEDGVVCE